MSDVRVSTGSKGDICSPRIGCTTAVILESKRMVFNADAPPINSRDYGLYSNSNYDESTSVAPLKKILSFPYVELETHVYNSLVSNLG